jgi:hypothetical protein
MLCAIILNASAQKSESEKIKDIRTRYYEIMKNLDNYDKQMIEDNDQSAEGGIIYYYLKDQKVKLIKAEYYGESGNLKLSYYFNEDKLFFMFSERMSYDVPIYVDDSGKGTLEENRYYFRDDIMIRWLDNEKKQVDKKVESYALKEAEIIKDAYNYLKMNKE